MKQTPKYIEVEYSDPISIMCDNSNTINILKNLVIHSRTKNIAIKYNFLREKLVEKEFKMEYVSTGEQVVDVFTNPLPKDTFEYLRLGLGIVSPSFSI